MMFDTLSARKKAFLGSAIQNRRPMMSDTLSARKKVFLGCPMQIPPEMAQICPPGSGKNPEFCIGHLLAHGGVLAEARRGVRGLGFLRGRATDPFLRLLSFLSPVQKLNI